MNRILIVFLVFAMLVGIIVIFSAGAFADTANDLNEFEIKYNISYYYFQHHNIEGFDGIFQLGYYPYLRTYSVYSAQDLAGLFPEGHEIRSKYNEAFFKDKFLAFIYGLRISDIKFRVTSVNDEKNIFNIKLNRDPSSYAVPSGELDGYCIVFEMDRLSAGKEISVMLDPPGDLDFGTVSIPYDASVRESVRVTIGPGQPSASLSGENADSFTLITTDVPSFCAIDLTITPKAGLAPGIYTAAVTVFSESQEISESFNVKFTVTSPDDRVAMPTASLNGGTFTNIPPVTLSCATKDAVIYYTTDGSKPTADSTLYTEPIKLANTATIKAIAVKDGMSDSEIMSVTFTKSVDVMGILNVTPDVNNNSVAVNINNPPQDGAVLIVAVYSGNKLLSVKTEPVTGESMTVDIDIPKEADTIKVMLWDSLNTLKALCPAETVKL